MVSAVRCQYPPNPPHPHPPVGLSVCSMAGRASEEGGNGEGLHESPLHLAGLTLGHKWTSGTVINIIPLFYSAVIQPPVSARERRNTSRY